MRGRVLAAAFAGHLFGFLGHAAFEEAGAEHHQGLGLVLVLGTFVLTADLESGGFVDDADGGVRGIHVLAAFSGRTIGIDAEVLFIDHDFNFVVDFGIHRCRGE